MITLIAESRHDEDGGLTLFCDSTLCRSSFVKEGKDCKLNNDVERVLKDFHRSRKPIGYVSFDHLVSAVGTKPYNSNNSLGSGFRAAVKIHILHPNTRLNCRSPLNWATVLFRLH